MSRIFVHGLGAVSPAGWGVAALQSALAAGEPLSTQEFIRAGGVNRLRIRPVPAPAARPEFFTHPRLRRSGAVTLHTVAAALEALGGAAAQVQSGKLRLGIVVCTMAGSVAYSRRFYEEVLRDPAMASPAIFPETVFNAPASHLAAYLGTNGNGSTLVGDDGTFLQGLAVAAGWLLNDQADGVVVVGVEELDWVVTEAMRLFRRDVIHTAGAGAVFLRREKPAVGGVELAAVTDSFSLTQNQSRLEAARKMRAQLPPGLSGELLVSSVSSSLQLASPETAAWQDWPGQRLEPKRVLGEAFVASAAWQCVAACAAVESGEHAAASVSVLGANQQAIGARFLACTA